MTLLIGAEPKKPAKKRVTNTDAAFVLTPVPMENNARQKTAGSMLILRPQISERGAQMIGPKTKPSLVSLLALSLVSYLNSTHKYSDTSNTATSLLTPVYLAMVSSAGVVMLDPRLPAKASMPS